LRVTEYLLEQKGENTRYEINFENLEKLISQRIIKVLFLCNPHNPTGRVWSLKEL
jgi:cysteine-S-conjugate beta-lyase